MGISVIDSTVDFESASKGLNPLSPASICMSVAELVMRQIANLSYAGSNPVAHSKRPNNGDCSLISQSPCL